ncbi:MAG: SDR family NAD(P)-dependent oxidoreductase [Myxococcota bacterium]
MNGLRAVVTGAGSGLGRAFAEVLAQKKGKILVSDVDLAGAEATATSVRALGGEAEVLRCDVRNAEEVEALAKHMEARFGGTDLVVNNAGVAVSGLVGDVALEDWRWIVDINLMGVIHGCHSFVPRFRAAKKGYIINVASAAGLVYFPTMGPYNATKAAVVALSESLHAELAGSGVHVTVLCPTFFQTNIANAGRGTSQEKDLIEVKERMQKSRVQAPEVATAALEAVLKNRVFCVPMMDGRWAWRLKRALPGLFPGLLAAVERRRRAT